MLIVLRSKGSAEESKKLSTGNIIDLRKRYATLHFAFISQKTCNKFNFFATRK